MSSNFIQTSLDIGTVKEFSSNPAVFYKTPECKKIKSLEPGCQCTTVSNETGFIKTTYVAEIVPPQNGNSVAVRKGITVTFEDGTQERLQIVGILTK